MYICQLICIKWITNKNLLYKKINKIKFKKKKKKEKPSVREEVALKVDSLMTSQLLLSCEHKYFPLEITVLQKMIEDVVRKSCVG